MFFSYLRKTLIIHIRGQTNHWCNPEFSINTCLLQIHFFTHVLLSSMATPECVWVMTYQFLRGCLWFLYFSNELNTVYSFMKMIFRKQLLQFLLWKKSTRRLLATQPPCSNETSSAETIKMAALSYALGTSLWKKWGSSLMWTGYMGPSCLILVINSENCYRC